MHALVSRARFIACAAPLFLFLACQRELETIAIQQPSEGEVGGSSDGMTTGGAAGSGWDVGGAAIGAGATGGGIVTELPADFSAADVGGFKLGGALMDDTEAGQDVSLGRTCGNILRGAARDFRGAMEPGGHPDFETFLGTLPTPALVASALGADRKPVYDSRCEQGQTLDAQRCPFGAQTTSLDAFEQWYRDAPGVNDARELFFYFQAQGDGLYAFSSTAFFPLDDAGFGNTPGMAHNFSFTTELHTRFRYQGGETFQFIGDDDVWVFFGDTLVVDLGGLHSRQERNVSLDDVAAGSGLVPGHVYDLHLFHAERHSSFSNFGIKTNLAFVNCGMVAPR